MNTLELRIKSLEKKCRTLTYSVAALMCFAAYASLSGVTTMNRIAKAQEEPVTPGEQIDKSALKLPTVVEAEVFILKDSAGNIRGVWNADENSASFAMMHKDKFPIAAISIDQRNASFSLTDVYKGKINLSLVNSVRSFSITDDTRDNNIYMGLTGNGEASFDMVSTGDSSIAVDGSKSRIDLTGDKTTIAMSETVGSTIALQAQPSSSIISVMDHQGKPTINLSTVDGKSQIGLNSPATKEEKIITTAPEEVVPVALAEEKEVEIEEGEASPEKTDAKQQPAEKKEETPKNSIVNMRTYSPFADK